MSQTNVQFSVASHVMAALAVADKGNGVRSAEIADSVHADPSFVRRVVSKLVKAGLVSATRGKNGACALARSPARITLLDIYRASQAPAAFAVHAYPEASGCFISRNIKRCMSDVLDEAQTAFEKSLSKQTLADLTGNARKGR